MTTASLTIVLTGATGGIGQALARALAAQHHRLVLLGRDSAALETLRLGLANPDGHRCYPVDLTDPAAIDRFCQDALAAGVDVLINNAGCAQFAMLEDSRDEARLLSLNLLAPIRLCRSLLPALLASGRGRIINVGSSFGGIGYPGFSLYCASKFGLRGFSEALQRELADQNIAVHYLAPRAVATEMNTAAVVAMNKALGNAMDTPEVVAQALLKLLSKGAHPGSRYLGWPERFFVRLNALLPGVVAKALRKQLPVIRRFAKANLETL
ncbi:short-chain dehydrogenase of unknown substrate specificity [Spongiibacter sp. IMCC21906]|uniref:SDR family oxidoreductase n=1 Tax=Spongiibacter sp. IMCC21906 TaxID=1620392 RepID=UPI00062DCF63|nr:SDR family oxidoreductase [Spongiibacter sp. IMCC21906]AKH70824.1 short-chain dehydrogenase of unknown substrate specificity [Spongiibacter sp. IMCC21906]